MELYSRILLDSAWIFLYCVINNFYAACFTTIHIEVQEILLYCIN